MVPGPDGVRAPGCFMGTEIDVLVIENCYLSKESQDPRLRLDYKSAFKPD